MNEAHDNLFYFDTNSILSAGRTVRQGFGDAAGSKTVQPVTLPRGSRKNMAFRISPVP
jgi:hypothetical protein